MPRTSWRSILAASEGVRLCATKMCGSAAENTAFGALPSRFRTIRRVTSCMSTARLHERGLEPRDLVSNLRRLNVITDNVIEIVANDVNDGAREPGRDACSAKSNFLVIAAHPRAIVERNQSS